MTPEQLKQQFRQRGETVAGWARANGYQRYEVYRVINGQVKAHFGKGHEIAVKLGLKPSPSETA